MPDSDSHFIDTHEGFTLVIEGGHTRGATDLERELRAKVDQLKAEVERLQAEVRYLAGDDDENDKEADGSFGFGHEES